MADPTSGNLGIPYPTGADQVSAGPTDFQDIVQILDAGGNGPTAVRIISGTLSNFTTTYQPNPGNYPLGTLYTATDADVSFLRDGTPAWRTVILAAHSQPIGTINMTAATSVPADPDGVTRWMLCQGQAVSRTTYSRLFALIGTAFGSGDGSTTFNLPDFRNNFPVGAGSNAALGATGGTWNHTHSVPGLSIPGLTIPSLTANPQNFNGLSIPSLSVSVFNHSHPLSANGGVQFTLAYLSGSEFWMFMGPSSSAGSFTTARTAYDTGMANWSSAANAETGYALYGNTDTGSASGITGTGTTGSGVTLGGTTQANNTGTGTTGTGTTGTANPPYVGINFQIKVL